MTLISNRSTFEFDLQGFVVYPQFLSSQEVGELNAICDGDPQLRQRIPKFRFVTLHPAFLNLLSHPEVLSLCEKWIHAEFKFDNAWGVQYPANYSEQSHENLHAGPFQNQGYFQYHWHNNRPFASCLVFAFVLADQLAGDGGIVLVPGSHKGNIIFSGNQLQQLLNGKMDAPWVLQPELRAGDLLLFTEAVIHGTTAWRPRDRGRRNLYYKYSLGCTSYYPSDDAETEELRRLARSETERNVLRQAYVTNVRAEGHQGMTWRSRTLQKPASVTPSSQGPQ